MADVTVIRASQLVNVDAGEVLPERPILVRDGRIEAVVSADESMPDGARMIDLDGLTILPGLIDCHSHLIGDLEFAGVPAT
ncbi:MAG: amidohydrolase family protein, partial [Chloroflexota bacterium]